MTTTTFRDAAMHSGLVTADQYARAVEIARTEDPDVVAATLVTSGTLTRYQSTQLKSGRTKLRLGPYLITDWIGQGGMGQVFKGVHDVLGRECAVKVLPLEKSTAESRECFTREIRLQAGLDYPHLVRAYDAGCDGSVHYLVTEYVPGTDLRKLIRQSGPLPMDQAARVVSQAALGLQYAHDLGLIHRDIKPGNILVTPDGHTKVSDVGLAAWSMGLDDDPRAGKVVGTADYLSPEQIRSPRTIGPPSDIYSLGCTLYYSVTGKVPFPGGDARSKCRRHLEQTPWHPRKFAAELTEDFVDVIADMMEKSVDRRVASAAEVAERLEPWAQHPADVIDRPIDRQSWTPPPPPKDPSQMKSTLPTVTGEATAGERATEDEQATEAADESGSAGGQGSAAGCDSFDGESGGGLPAVPGSFSGLAGGSSVGKPSSVFGAVAVALAIAIPASLLVGAILGFLVRGKI